MLVTLGIDVTYELHQETINRLEQRFDKLCVADSQRNDIQAAYRSDVVAAVKQSEVALSLRDDANRQQAEANHAETKQQFEYLRLAISEIHTFKTHPKPSSNSIVRKDSSLDQDQLCLALLMKILSKFAQ